MLEKEPHRSVHDLAPRCSRISFALPAGLALSRNRLAHCPTEYNSTNFPLGLQPYPPYLRREKVRGYNGCSGIAASIRSPRPELPRCGRLGVRRNPVGWTMRDLPVGPRPARLGRVERAILDAMAAAGGLIARDVVRDIAYPPPSRGRRKHVHPERTQDPRARALAEAAISRAIVSLERKGLIVREHNRNTGRTTLRSPGQKQLPVWEETARAEEDMAAHCLRLSRAWSELARKSQSRAKVLRAERSVDSTESERRDDLKAIEKMEAGEAQ